MPLWLPEAVREFPGRVYTLQGGFDALKTYALTPPKPPGPEATVETLAEYRFQAAVYRSLTSTKTAPPPPRKTIKYVPKNQRKTGGCG
jgi:hypothetical protein